MRLIACRPATAVKPSSVAAKPGRGFRTGVPGERVSPRRDRIDGDAIGRDVAGEPAPMMPPREAR
jgi:hypothetical protein